MVFIVNLRANFLQPHNYSLRLAFSKPLASSYLVFKPIEQPLSSVVVRRVYRALGQGIRQRKAVTLVVSSLVFAATDTAFRKTLNSLESADLSVLYAALMVIQPRTFLISFCTILLRTHCVARSLATLFLYTTSGSNLGKLTGF